MPVAGIESTTSLFSLTRSDNFSQPSRGWFELQQIPHQWVPAVLSQANGRTNRWLGWWFPSHLAFGLAGKAWKRDIPWGIPSIPIHTQKNGHFNIFEQGKLTIQWIRGAKIWRHGRPEEHERKPDGGMMKRSLAPQVMSFHPYSTHMKKKSAGWEDSYNHIDDLWSLFNMGLFRILRAYYDYHWFNIYYSRSVNDSSMFKTQVLSKIEAWLAADLALQRWPWPWFFPNWGVVSQPNLQKAGLNRPLSIDRIKGAFHRVSMTGMCMELFDSMGRLWPCWSVSLGAEMHRDARDMIIMISQE